MKFSIIVPSYNQEAFITQTLVNLSGLKKTALEHGIEVEVLVFDNMSNQQTLNIINRYRGIIDYIEIEKDNGQFDAINKGIKKITGDYWTWLNTDDLIDIDGFLKTADILQKNLSIDYIYGNIKIIDEQGNYIKTNSASVLTADKLINTDPGIFQPGSFFKKKFTDTIGLLFEYKCCFDYEYILRVISYGGKLYMCSHTVSSFRLHSMSKTQKVTSIFVKEQLAISKKYGRRLLSKHTLIAFMRLIKHFLFTDR